MKEERFAGILAILVTPLTPDQHIDEESHRAQVRFCIEAGATGVISTAVFGEFFTLTDSERVRLAQLTVEAAAGEVPVIATTSGVSKAHAVELTRNVCEAGVDGVMAMPPYFAQLSADGVFDYFDAIGNACSVPVILQNAGDFIGAPVAPAQLNRMFSEIGNLQYLKEEVPPNPHSISSATAALGDRVKGIFGGHGGRYMVTEHRRGATGWMPAPEFLEVTVRIYDLLRSGDEAEARNIHGKLVQALVWEQLYGIQWAKQVLKRRGVIQHSAVRMPGPALDAEDDHEIDLILADFESLLTTPGPFEPTGCDE